ncbi:MAG: hypothetical protein IJH31_01730 [Erysipelotrichaceae bacterium]|nr:hypothetical protein [Erysipelotrichaceae bacterium]
MKLEEFLKEANGGYMFIDHNKANEKGYATAEDIICEINYSDDDYFVRIENYRHGKANNELVTFNNLDELLNYVVEEKTIRERIEEEKELLYYHIRTIAIDEDGRVLEG